MEFRSTVVRNKLRASEIRRTVDDISPDSPIFGKTFCFTGGLGRMLRRDAMQLVVNLGGCCTDGVTKKTDYLVLGNSGYTHPLDGGKSGKRKRAEALQLKGGPIEIISEDVWFAMIESKSPGGNAL